MWNSKQEETILNKANPIHTNSKSFALVKYANDKLYEDYISWSLYLKL